MKLIETVISAGVGAADIAIGEISKGKTVVGPLTAQDVFRFTVTAGALAASFLDLEGKGPREGYSDFVFYVSLPLLEQTIYKLVKEKTHSGGSSSAALPTLSLNSAVNLSPPQSGGINV